MNLKDNYLFIAIIIVAMIVLVGIFISAGSLYMEKSYINITEDGAIKFDTTGFEVTQIDVLEDAYTGQFDNKTFYSLTDNFGRKIEIVIHYSSMNNSDSQELKFLNSDYYQNKPIWVGNHTGYYYSVSIDNPSGDIDSNWVKERIVIE